MSWSPVEETKCRMDRLPLLLEAMNGHERHWRMISTIQPTRFRVGKNAIVSAHVTVKTPSQQNILPYKYVDEMTKPQDSIIIP